MIIHWQVIPIQSEDGKCIPYICLELEDQGQIFLLELPESQTCLIRENEEQGRLATKKCISGGIEILIGQQGDLNNLQISAVEALMYSTDHTLADVLVGWLICPPRWRYAYNF
jgi:hypothetical protein